ncbi:MAG: acyl-CoA dehydrogenase family protein, partial [Pseudomonadales bacterium]|nr:acyl-CoA dehydrogenase family protein [Pseudomonadales bacterium]
MDLSYGSEYESFREEVKSFIESNRDKAPDRKGNGLSWQKILIENGYAARTIPKEYGGYGAEPDILKSRIIAEEFAKAQVSTGLGGQGISMLVPT